jgi:anti-anti-sigma factor
MDEYRAADWPGPVALLQFPEHLDGSGAADMSSQVRAALRDGAAVLVADMSATSSCDRAGLDVLIRAYQLAAVSRAELRLVVTGTEVGRLVAEAGLDRLVPVFGSVDAAVAAGSQGRAAPGAAARPAGAPQWPARPQAGLPNGSGPTGPSAALLLQLIDALDDGIMLADDGTIVLANRHLTDMFGYQEGELTGQPVETLVPADRRDEHRKDRAAYGRAPVPRPMAGRDRLAGVRKDGGTLPVTITLSPVRTAGGHFVLAVVRDATREQRWGDLASLVGIAVADQEERSDALLDRVVSSLLHVGLSLQAAVDQPADVARQRITDALTRLDEVIHEIRDHFFRSRRSGGGGSP